MPVVLLLAVLPMVLLQRRLVVLLLLLLAEELTAIRPAGRSLASTRQIWRALGALASRSNSGWYDLRCELALDHLVPDQIVLPDQIR